MEFKEWFRQQFGDLSTKPTWELRQDYEGAEAKYLGLKVIYDKQSAMEVRFLAARKAWAVKEEVKIDLG